VGNSAELGLEAVAGPSAAMHGPVRALGARITALNDKARDDSMKNSAIVKIVSGKGYEIINVVWGGVREKPDVDLTQPGLDNRPGRRHIPNFLIREPTIVHLAGDYRRCC